MGNKDSSAEWSSLDEAKVRAALPLYLPVWADAPPTLTYPHRKLITAKKLTEYREASKRREDFTRNLYKVWRGATAEHIGLTADDFVEGATKTIPPDECCLKSRSGRRLKDQAAEILIIAMLAAYDKEQERNLHKFASGICAVQGDAEFLALFDKLPFEIRAEIATDLQVGGRCYVHGTMRGMRLPFHREFQGPEPQIEYSDFAKQWSLATHRLLGMTADDMVRGMVHCKLSPEEYEHPDYPIIAQEAALYNKHEWEVENARFFKALRINLGDGQFLELFNVLDEGNKVHIAEASGWLRRTRKIHIE